MKPKYLLPYIFVILSISIIYAQEPLLLETIEQNFNHQTQEWEDEYKTIYSYDQNGKMTGRHRYNLDACKVENPDDYCDYQKRKSHRSEIWRYNKAGFEILYTDVSYEFVKKEGENYQVRDVNYVKRETDYKDDSLITQQVSVEKFNFCEEEDRYRQININTTINRYNQKNKVIYSENKTEYIENDEMDNFNVQSTSYNFSDDRLISQVEAERIFYQGDTMEYRDNLTEFHYNQYGLISEELITSTYKSEWNGPSSWQSKVTYHYNSKQLLEERSRYYWDSNTSTWGLSEVNNYEYFENGIEKNVYTKQRSGEIYYVYVQNNDENGRAIFNSSETQDELGNVVEAESWMEREYFDGNKEGSQVWSYNSSGELNYSWLSCIEYNQDNQQIRNQWYWWNYEADTLEYRTVNDTKYEYDSEGFLVREDQKRHLYYSDSILMIGCCGGIYDKVTTYENRCDGAALIANIDYTYYQGGTNWEFESNYQYRELNKFSTALCESYESEPVDLKVYPNPTNSKITIDSKLLQTHGTKLNLVDLSGKLLISEMAQISTGYQINFESFSPGIYILKLTNEFGSAEQKIVYYR